MSEIKFIDLFAGIGGFRYSFDSLGCRCVFSSEINESCQQVYEKNYGDKPHGDIMKINADEIPDFDILCAGFPCQPFSVCGKQKGFEDTRGTLFFEICRIIKVKQPSVVFLENVKNLVTHNKGATFSTILKTLETLKYNVSYKVLNSKDFGIPQSRERIIIIATKKGFFDFSKLQYKKSLPVESILEKDVNFEYLSRESYTLIDKQFIKKQPSGLIFVGYRNKGTWKVGIRPNTEHLSRVHRQPNRIYSSKGIFPTLPAQETSGRFWIYIPEEDKVRRLTLNECYRLMGYPNNFIKDSNKSNAYLQCGNSVVIPMITSIANEIINQGFLGEKNGVFGRNLQELNFGCI